MADLRVRFRVGQYDTPHIIDWKNSDGSQSWGLEFIDGLILEFDTLKEIEAFARDLLEEVTRDD